MFFSEKIKKEPQHLIIVRVLVIIIILSSIVAVAVIQFLKLRNPVYIYQSRESTMPIPMPTVIFYSKGASLLDVTIEVKGRYNGAENKLDQGLMSLLKQLTWGKDVIDSSASNVNGTVVIANDTTVWSFQPSSTYRFTPTGKRDTSDTADQHYYTDITIEIIGRKTDNKSSGIEGQGELDIVVLEDAELLHSARRNNKPVDVRLLSNNLKTLAYKDYEQKIKIEYSEDEKKGRTSPRYNLKTNLVQQESATWQTKSPTRPDIIRVSLEPYNTPADNSNGFRYEIRNAVKNFTFADCYGTIGGAFTIALYVFALLFGQRRLRPWGLVQTYVFRKQLLGQVPKSVAKINSSDTLIDSTITSGTPKATSQQEKQSSRLQQGYAIGSNNESDSVVVDIPDRSITNDTSNNLSSNELVNVDVRLLVQEHEQLKKLVHTLISARDMPQIYNDHMTFEEKADKRMAELEAFRQRMETFYLADDLFIKKKEKQSDNK